MNIFEHKINLITSTVIAFLSAILGDFWFLFMFLLGLNVLDYITGTMKARYLKIESSSQAFKGTAKTFYTWVLIAIAFGLSIIFIEVGKQFGKNLKFMLSIGWFMLTHCIVNEIRSILENIVQLDKGNIIPTWLIRGLEVTQNLVDQKANAIVDKLEKKENKENKNDNTETISKQ